MNDELNLDALSRDELREQAKILGLSQAGSVSELRERLRETLGEARPVSDSAETPAVVHPQEQGQKRHRIMIPETESDTQPVQVFVNGRAYIIKRGEEVNVPASVVEVLNHAKQRVYNPKTMTSREVLSYPYQLLG